MFDSKARLTERTYDSFAEMVQAYAQEAVRIAREQHRVRLDFTPSSVEALERLLDGQAAVDLEFQSRLWGCYFGEVLRFRWEGEWLLAPYPGGGETATPTLEIRGSRLYPTLKVYRRLTLGAGENLCSFYQMVQERLDKKPTHALPGEQAPTQPGQG